MQYRELQDLLEAEKSSNIQLQAKVNILRSELQIANSNGGSVNFEIFQFWILNLLVKRLKHQKVKSNAATEIGGELTPGTTSTILDMVKPTPSEPATPKQTSEKSQRTKPRMKHDIPHRFEYSLHQILLHNLFLLGCSCFCVIVPLDVRFVYESFALLRALWNVKVVQWFVMKVVAVNWPTIAEYQVRAFEPWTSWYINHSQVVCFNNSNQT